MADDYRIPEIIVTSRTKAGKILVSPSKGSGIRHIISIGDPGERWPSGLRRHPARRHRAEFHDVHAEGTVNDFEIPPTRENVSRLVKFCAGIRGEATLIHCSAGVSRSSAAAFILLAMALRPGGEDDAATRLFNLSDSELFPNQLMVKYADDILERGGAMVLALR